MIIRIYEIHPVDTYRIGYHRNQRYSDIWRTSMYVHMYHCGSILVLSHIYNL